jgi:hypothetical protein
LIDIPPEVAIKSSLQYGSVYYFPEEAFSSSGSHYFFVLNKNPTGKPAIFLVHASFQIEKVRARRKTCPPNTLVELGPSDYKEFTRPTIVDCNEVYVKTIDQIIRTLEDGKLLIMPEINQDIINKFVAGVLNSPLVEKRIQVSLRNEG